MNKRYFVSMGVQRWDRVTILVGEKPLPVDDLPQEPCGFLPVYSTREAALEDGAREEALIEIEEIAR